MAIQKSNLNVPFLGLDQKSDPFKIAPGNFLNLTNTVPIKGGQQGNLLQKRNGNAQLASLPDSTYQYTTTFNNNLTAVGSNLAAYAKASSSWVTKGTIIPMQLETLSLIRTSSNQSQCDSAVSSNNLVCTVFTETSPSTAYKYAIADSVTGQNIVAPTTLATPGEGPRVFLLGNYFIILWSQAGTLKYISIPINNVTSPSSATSLVTNYAAGALTQPAFDGVVYNNSLYVVYNASDGGGAIRISYLDSFLVRQTAATGVNIANAKTADIVSVCADSVSPTIWASFYKTAGTTGYVVALDPILVGILSATQFVAAGTLLNLTSTATSGIVTVFYELSTVYAYGASLPTNVITKRTCTTAGVLGTATTVIRSLGLASKAILVGTTPYMLGAYSSSYQPSYFLVDSSGNIAAKLAYSNGGGYLTLGLPQISKIGTVLYIPYLIKDLLIATNKSQAPASNAPVFTQTGISLASFDFTTDGMNSSEIGSNLHISGGILWAYDGYQIVEQGFNVYPDNVIVTTATGAGGLIAQTYYYVAIYEWTDNQGNVHRSAPSLAVAQVTTTASSTNTIKVPTLRLTYKTANPVKIVLYRWSTAQQTYYQVTSLTSPTLNSTTADSVTITDAFADNAIVGNSILYTAGGVVENVGAPSVLASTLFKSRVVLLDAEIDDLAWYSKQVIQGTPVELSDLFTIFIAPTTGAVGSTGKTKCVFPMDDKLLFFKKDAIYYIVGNGPDNTGANNDFSEPVFITSTVGCENQNSIVMTPNGVMFQSDKGIWLLGRDLSTTYIGSAVESFNESSVLSAINVPGTNQVRFTLDTGETLMYDYFFQQWGIFEGAAAISSTLYESLHTFIDSYGRAFQENPGSYLDGSRPVLMSFITAWFNLAGLQGFERAYSMYLLGTYLSPHKLTVSIAYDYNSSPSQSVVITPENFSAVYGGDSLYGGSSVNGGPSNIEQWRIFFEQQKCEAFQITIQESYDASFGVAAGAGLTLSGLDLVVGMKSSYPRLRAAVSTG